MRGISLDSHFSWQIRTFWYALLLMALAGLIAAPLMLIVVGFLTFWLAAMVVGVGVLYRVERDWMRLASGLPMSV